MTPEESGRPAASAGAFSPVTGLWALPQAEPGPALGRWLRVAVLLSVTAGVLLAVTALATPEEAGTTSVGPGPRTAPGPSDPAALALLRRSASTARLRSWTGSQVISVLGSRPSTVGVAVAHPARAAPRSRVLAGAGAGQQEILNADGAGLPGSSPLGAPVVGDGARWESLVTSSYAVTLAGGDTVAGEPVDVVELRRTDGTAAARVAVGRRSGLALQRQTFDGRGALLRSSAFSRVALVPAAAVADVPDDGGAVQASAPTVAPRAADVASARAVGYAVPDALAPGLVLVDARRTGPDSDAALHLTYSDGLSAISVFEQRGRLAPGSLPGWQARTRSGVAVLTRPGLPERVAWADGAMVYTLLADAPDEVVDHAVTALPHVRPAVGLAHRLRRGVDRVGSWLDPNS